MIAALTTAEWAQLAGTAFTAIAASAALLTVIRAERDRWDRRLPDFQVEALRDIVADEARLTIANYSGRAEHDAVTLSVDRARGSVFRRCGHQVTGADASHADPYRRNPLEEPKELRIDASEPVEKVQMDCFHWSRVRLQGGGNYTATSVASAYARTLLRSEERNPSARRAAELLDLVAAELRAAGWQLRQPPGGWARWRAADQRMAGIVSLNSRGDGSGFGVPLAAWVLSYSGQLGARTGQPRGRR